MKNRLLTALFLCLCLALGACGDKAEKNAAAVSALETEISALRSSLDNQDSKLVALTTEVGGIDDAGDDLEALDERLTELSGQIEAIESSQAELTALAASLKERATPAAEIETLTRRLQSLDEKTGVQLAEMQRRVNAAEQALTAQVREKQARSAFRTPARKTPPFTIIGTESRGDETILIVASRNAQSLNQSVLLREGESFSGWRLKSLRGDKAVFTVDGQEQIIALP